MHWEYHHHSPDLPVDEPQSAQSVKPSLHIARVHSDSVDGALARQDQQTLDGGSKTFQDNVGEGQSDTLCFRWKVVEGELEWTRPGRVSEGSASMGNLDKLHRQTWAKEQLN